MNLMGLGYGLLIFLWQVAVVTAPALVGRYLAHPGKKLTLEEVWMLSVSSAALQAVLGTLWSVLQLPFAEAEPLVWLACSSILGMKTASSSFSFQRCTSPLWLILIVGITLISRLVPAALHESLGQSDAYSHLQFGLELLHEGELSNSVYPPAHAWVHTLPARIPLFDTYSLYRFGGAAPALGLILAIFFATKRAVDERAAGCSALIAAGCPLVLPLLKTGVGVFANQYGLLMAGLLLWALPRRPGVSILAATALATSVPMMTPDLAIPVVAYAILCRRPVLAATLTGIAAVGIALVTFRIMARPPEHLQGTLSMLLATDMPVTPFEAIRAYLFPVSVPFPFSVRCGVFGLSVAAGLSLLHPKLRHPAIALFPLLTVTTGLQTALGIFQFPAYLRAGWLFFIGVSVLTGLVSWAIAQKISLAFLTRPALALSSLGLIWLPPTHSPQLSQAEDELVQVFRYLEKNPPEAPHDFWIRPLTGFSGNQGDPAHVFLSLNPKVIHRQVTRDEDPILSPTRASFLVLERVEPPVSGNPTHDLAVRTFWELNEKIRSLVDQEESRLKEWSLPDHPLKNIRIWVHQPGETDSTP